MSLQGMSIKVDNLVTEVAKQSKEARARERTRSPTPGPFYGQTPGAEGVSYDVGPRCQVSSSQGYNSREPFNPRYQDDRDEDCFDDDDYVYSLSQGQRDANRQRREEHGYPPPQDYQYPLPKEYRYLPPQDYSQGGSRGYGYNSSQSGQGYGNSHRDNSGGLRGTCPWRRPELR